MFVARCALHACLILLTNSAITERSSSVTTLSAAATFVQSVGQLRSTVVVNAHLLPCAGLRQGRFDHQFHLGTVEHLAGLEGVCDSVALLVVDAAVGNRHLREGVAKTH